MLDSPEFTFLEIGANDGVCNDPIRPYVAKYHWSGVLVEPQREAFQALCANYSGETQLRFENVAISARAGSQLFYSVDRTRPGMNDQTDQLASFMREVVMSHCKYIPGLADALVTEEVPCMTFSELLSKHDLRRLDLLQIDTEGYDYEIIKTIDFGKVKPRIIHYEHIHLKAADREACIKLLVGEGYQIAVLGSFDTLAYQPTCT